MPTTNPPSRLPRAATWLALALPALLAALAYGEVGSFGFVLDDHNALVDHAALRAGDAWRAAFGEYTSLANRLLPCLSFTLDFRLGLAVGTMHFENVALHAINAVLVVVAVRGALRAPNLRAGFTERRALLAACAAACLWAVHPLGVDAVAYLTQRSTLLASMGALVAFLLWLRADGAARPWRWLAAATAAAALAMASKEEVAALPLLLALADRALLSPDWASWRRRWRRHALPHASWCVLLSCVALGPENPTVGYATVPPITAWHWLLTQAQVSCHYARAIVLPNDLRGIYDFAIVRTVGDALLPGLAVLGALAATLWAWRARPWLGFVGAFVFLLLAPTSSVLPIVTEPAADRRMYLPLVAVIAAAAAGGLRALGPRWFTAVVAVVVVALGLAARGAARIYRDQRTMITHAGTANELTNGSFMAGRILGSYGAVLYNQGRTAEAAVLYERAVRCEAPGRVQLLNFARLRADQGRTAEAEAVVRQVVRDYPQFVEAQEFLARLVRVREGR